MWVPPVKNPCVMTSYGGIIRIRLKGRSWITSSQPASQAPLYLFHFLVYTGLRKKQVPFKIYFLFAKHRLEHNSVIFLLFHPAEIGTHLIGKAGQPV